MIRKLRKKFTLTIMSIVTIMMLTMFALIFYTTKLNMQMQGLDLSSQTETLNNLIAAFFTIGIEAFMIFFVASIFLSKWAIKPVETAWRDQRRFVADASHELKTPLSVIMTNSQLALSEKCSDEDRKEYVDKIEKTSHQMKSLIEDMLELARSEDDAFAENISRLNLSEIINNLALVYEPLFYEKKLDFNYEVEKDIMVVGQANELYRMVEILLDNAKKYCIDSGSVELLLKKTKEKTCTLTIENNSKTFEVDELENIFKRFYRCDEARKRDGGYGLGLPIAKSIVEKHGGAIDVSYADNKIKFQIELKTNQKEDI